MLGCQCRHEFSHSNAWTAAARPTSPWALDPNDIPQRSTTSTFLEPTEEQGRLCPIAGCDTTSRLVHLPWFSKPVTACWICGVQYVKGTKLKDHWRWHHWDVNISTNRREHCFDDYFWKVESFMTSASALRRGEASLSEIFQEISMLDDFAVLNASVVCPGLGLFESFLTRHGETPVSQYRISPRPDLFACLLHWRVLLQLLVPLTPEQRQRVLDEHGWMPEQSEMRTRCWVRRPCLSGPLKCRWLSPALRLEPGQMSPPQIPRWLPCVRVLLSALFQSMRNRRPYAGGPEGRGTEGSSEAWKGQPCAGGQAPRYDRRQARGSCSASPEGSSQGRVSSGDSVAGASSCGASIRFCCCSFGSWLVGDVGSSSQG